MHEMNTQSQTQTNDEWQETSQFQNRLSRSMMECQDKARDQISPGMENNARKIAQVEGQLLQCMGKTVDSHIKLLKPMKDRLTGQLKKMT